MSDDVMVSEQAQPKTLPAFDGVHALLFALCWFPLNPLTLVVYRSLLSPHGPHWSDTDWRGFLLILLQSIFGPFTAALEGRNEAYCLQFAMRALPICGGALLLATLVQWSWRPTQKWKLMARYGIWTTGWVIWFLSAFISILNNSG